MRTESYSLLIKEDIFSFLEFLSLFSSSSGRFLPPKPRWKAGGALSQQRFLTPTHCSSGELAHSLSAGGMKKWIFLPKQGWQGWGKPESMPTLYVLELDLEPLITTPCRSVTNN